MSFVISLMQTFKLAHDLTVQELAEKYEIADMVSLGAAEETDTEETAE